MQPKNDSSEVESTPSYLISKLADELYGTTLLKIREVIKMAPIKPVPYMVRYFKGVINLRGQIVGIIDLRAKFELPVADASQPGMILVIETNGALIGAVVDDLVSVENIESKEIDYQPAVETRLPTAFFEGVAKKGDRLINLVDIGGCITSADMRAMRQTEKVA